MLEVALGVALVALPKERRRLGAATAAYFVAIFPGNIAQLAKRQDAFGLDSDLKRFLRLFFQPVLVLAALFGGENISTAATGLRPVRRRAAVSTGDRAGRGGADPRDRRRCAARRPRRGRRRPGGGR